jgi:uncharacterized phage protein (TIGR02220 family)
VSDWNLLEAIRAVFASSLSANEKLVALALLNHWSKNRETFPGVGRLVTWTSLSRRSVLRAIGTLEALGAIRIERKVGLANRYDLTPLAALTSATQAPVPEGHRCPPDTPPVPEGHGSSATQAPDQCHTGTRSDPVRDPRRDPGKRSTPPGELEVFDTWASKLFGKISKRKPKRSPERLKHIRARLKDGYSVDELRRVIDHVAANPFMLGQNERGTPYIEPKTIFASAGKVDQWLASKPPKGKVQTDGTDQREAETWGRDGAAALGAE